VNEKTYPDVRRIEAGPRVDERIGVHVANPGEQAGRLRAQHVRRRAVAGRTTHRIADAASVLHHRDEAVAGLDLSIPVGCRRHCDAAAILVRPGGAAPCDAEHARFVGGIRESVDVAKIVGLLRRED